jgi:hypothetical protein
LAPRTRGGKIGPVTQLAQLETPIPGVYASAPEPLPFTPALIWAFVLRREHGNVLVYSVSEFGSEASGIAELGGISHLSGRHTLDFDVFVPWAASSDQPYCAVTSHADTRRRVRPILGRVRGGEDH